MGLYTDQIRERYIQDQKLEAAADQLLMEHEGAKCVADEMARAEAALEMVFAAFDVPFRRVLDCNNLDELIESTTDSAGVMCEKTDLSDRSFVRGMNWILAQREDGRFVVLRPSLLGYCCVDAESGKSQRFGRNIRLKNTGYTLHRPLVADRNSAKGIARMILRLITVRDMVMILLCTLLISLLGLAIPEINAWLLGEVLPQGNAAYGTLLYGMVLFATVGILRAAINVFKGSLLSEMRIRISTQVQSALMSRVLLASYSGFSNSSAGKVSKKIHAGQQLANRMINVLLDTSFTLIFSLIYIPQMLRYAPSLCIPALAMLLVKVLISVCSFFAYAKNNEALLENDMEINGMLYPVIRGIQKIKSVNAESRIYAKWARLYMKHIRLQLDPPAIMKLKTVLQAFISSLCSALLLTISASTGVGREDYITFNAVYALVISAVTQLTDVMESVFLMGPLVRQVDSLMEVQDEDCSSRQYVHSLRGRITLENVSFAYPDGAKSSLHDISLDIRPGQKVAIVGESGSGKSTLLKLLLGMEKPDQGNISYDGRSMNTLDGRSLRKRIGSVMQFSRVMPGSLYDNIIFASSQQVGADEVWKAAEKAAIADVIRDLPLGMDTEISESAGGGFSGGQRQRLLIARALLSSPAVLLLDEATSALDNITQKQVLDAIYREKATVIMVAHRLSTIVNCDFIVMLEKGRIVEKGKYADLISKNGKFAELVRKQQE